MQRLAILLALSALGFAGWQAWEGQNLRDDLQAAREQSSTLEARVIGLERQLGALTSETGSGLRALPRGSLAPDVRTADGGAPAVDAHAPVPAESDGATLKGRVAPPAVLTKAVRDLQQDVADLRQRNEDLQKQVAKAPHRYKPPTVLRDLDTAEKQLSLSPGQRADIERIVDYTKRDLEDLYNTPNDDGKTWNDVRKEKTRITTTGDAPIALFMGNMQDQMAFRRSKVPGTDETYAQAAQRIRSRGKQDVKNVLSPSQQKSWDQAYTDPLFGSQGLATNTVSVVSISTTPDSK